VQKLTIVGEAAAHISAELRVQHPEIIWTDVVAFRNILIHTYFGIDWSIVWDAATEDVPRLRPQIVAILHELPPL
jgi:uncharacterized protein with HEPN domain